MLAVILGLVAILFSSCAKPQMAPQTQYVLGTVCTVNLFEDGTPELYRDIFSELNLIDDEFSVNKEYSEISKVNQGAGTGRGVPVSKEVFQVVEQATEFARLTRNSFNPAMGTLIKMWGIGTDHQRVPDKEEIAEALEHCNPDAVLFIEVPGFEESENLYMIEITDSKTQLDLGAIVKGYAADRLVELLKSRNVSRAVIDLGGNIYVHGPKSKKDSSVLWNVGIKNPFGTSDVPVKVVSLKNGSVVTSGNYERFFEKDGIRYHHILDGHTGRPAESGLASVSVIGEKSVVCDALATALYVLGMGDGGQAVISEFSEKYDFVFLAHTGEIVIK